MGPITDRAHTEDIFSIGSYKYLYVFENTYTARKFHFDFVFRRFLSGHHDSVNVMCDALWPDRVTISEMMLVRKRCNKLKTGLNGAH